MNQKFWLVTYDIANQRRLRRVAALMTQFGVRVQKSVFECWLTDQALRELQKRIAPLLEPQQDSVRYYPLCADCRNMAAQNASTVCEPPEKFYIV